MLRHAPRRSMSKINYLNNRDILKEIHKSKSSYCTFLSPKFADYDLIIHNLDEITPVTIQEATKNRAIRLAEEQQAIAIKENPTQPKPKLDKFTVDINSITAQELVFRLMTWDHVPKNLPVVLDDSGDEVHTEYDEETVNNAKFVKINFPPFQHYMLNENNEPVCVGKSHWAGDLESGQFTKDGGKMTNKLALMFMKLCERYSSRGNWRNYTYVDEMRSQALLQLSQVGLQFDEAKSSNPFSYFTMVLQNSFTRVLNIEKRNQNIRDDILEMNSMNPSYTRMNASTTNNSAERESE